jgi:hypothetical protein
LIPRFVCPGNFLFDDSSQWKKLLRMNPKRWFAWLCLALMVVTEIFLFAAVRQKDAAQTELRQTQAQMWQVRKEMEELKSSSSGLQAAENTRLHKQIDIYTNRLAKAQAMIDQLEVEAAQTAQSLAKARAALQLQQEHLQELESEKKLVTDAGMAIIHRNTCIENLRMIDAAKQQWALEKDKTMDAVPRQKDLLPYLKGGVFPTCPDGGTYSINNVDSVPTCSVPGHVLPQ